MSRRTAPGHPSQRFERSRPCASSTGNLPGCGPCPRASSVRRDPFWCTRLPATTAGWTIRRQAASVSGEHGQTPSGAWQLFRTGAPATCFCGSTHSTVFGGSAPAWPYPRAGAGPGIAIGLHPAYPQHTGTLSGNILADPADHHPADPVHHVRPWRGGESCSSFVVGTAPVMNPLHGAAVLDIRAR